jgi:DNA-binding phage protein
MMPDNEMGSPDNLTTEKLVKAAKAGGNPDLRSVMENMVKTYESKIKGTPRDTARI